MNTGSPHNHQAFSDQERLSVLQLIRSENVGPITFHNLMSYYGSAAKALEAIPELAKRGGSKRTITLCTTQAAEAEYEAITRYGAKVICCGEADYPALLAEIPDAPAVISVLGNPAVYARTNLIGMVGARNASANGCAFAKKIAMELAQKQITIVSGLARGIDTAAHRGSLAGGTVAVIAGGIDNIYPPENEALYKEIAAAGAIISEAPFGTTPKARHFPSRNRVIAGMTRGVVVAEASEKSGSLITANFALDYGRDVFAVPGSPMDPRCKGSNDLIRHGAILTESIEDILNNLSSPKRDLFSESDKSRFTAAPAAVLNEDAMEKHRRCVIEKLGPDPVLLDELIAQCHVTPSILHIIMLELELAGRLSRHSGGKVSLRMELE